MVTDASIPRIKTLETGTDYGKFVVEPLVAGFGSTVGNALRRVLLSSIPGAAVTSIKIDCVLHQFSSIEGVKEDVTELILNLRNLFVKVNSGANGTYTISLNVTGPGEVTGADIVAPAEVEIANPDVHIAMLSDESAKLVAEMTVEVGKGYVLPDEQKNIPDVIGIIPMASVFTPIRKVNYSVEPTRVGHDTNFDRLLIEVTTNGTIAPDTALSAAAKILTDQLKLFVNFADTEGEAVSDTAGAGSAQSGGGNDTRIEDLNFSVRTYNCLKNAEILTLSQLITCCAVDLMEIKNFGAKSLKEVNEKLAGMGLSLRSDDKNAGKADT
ncbi:MAG: DNA-directed RNA polymerase subunit alpha [Abditibacteriota bacterium]|nr:DNA-directed RNA polymerase subunit alpha [Abditibacteriota bacterium]